MNEPHPSLKYYLALLRTPHLGPRTFLALVNQFTNLSEIFAAQNRKHLEKRLPQEALNYLLKPDWNEIEQDLVWATQTNHHIITLHDPHYPLYLREIPDPPIVLYIKGCLETLSSLQIAIVGTRNPSFLGRENAFQFAYQLAQSGITITSGLARGIDECAHQGALKANQQTIAVLGCGMHRLYPKQHIVLAEKITESGALVSEFPLRAPPLAKHFPQRNRIISGLSRGVLVVEAAMRSGSLVTARLANEQGRDVFAIPGSIQNNLTKGCHYLIREGAKLVETAGEILEELGFKAPPAFEKTTIVQFSSRDEKKVWEALDFEETPIDIIILRSGLTIRTVSSILLSFERKGLVLSAPMGYLRIAKKL